MPDREPAAPQSLDEPAPAAGATAVGDPVAEAPTTSVGGGDGGLATGNPVRRTRTSATFNGLLGATLVLILLIIFILENTQSVKISFLGLGGHVPLGVAMLIAAVAGGLLLGLVGGARIVQLRHRAKRAL